MTDMEISVNDIEQLRQEAGMAGDTAMVAACDAALAGGPQHPAWHDCERAIAECRARQEDETA